jgi:FMN phosphatase YigB (HAD superfamily)
MININSYSKVLAFDLDNTLFNYDIFLYSYLDKISGKKASLLLNKHSFSIEKLAKYEKNKAFYQYKQNLIKKLDSLSRIYKLVLITDSSPKEVLKKLNLLGVTPYFSKLYLKKNIFDSKILLARFFFVHKEHNRKTHMVGDHLIKDIIIPRLLGYDCILIKEKTKWYHSFFSRILKFKICDSVLNLEQSFFE